MSALNPVVANAGAAMTSIHEHQALLVDTLWTLADSAAFPNWGALKRAVDDASRFARSHFAQEEAVMEALFYPDIDHHRQQHLALTIEVTLLCDEIIRHTDHDHLSRTLTFLEHWFQHHVETSDRLISEWQLARQVQSIGDLV